MSNSGIPKEHKTKHKVYKYFVHILKIFLKETTLHALRFVGDTSLTLLERFYFMVSFVTVLIVAFNLAIGIFHKWHNTPVIIGMNSYSTPIQSLPFPAITICNMNQAKLSKVGKFPVASLDYAMLQKICFQPLNYTAYNRTQRGPEDTFTNFIVRNAQPCEQMIVRCKFGPTESNCTDFFREVIMDEGLCCAFNVLHPFFLYKGDYQFIRDYTTMSKRIPVDWNPETGYPKNMPPDFYPRVGDGTGVSMGFTIVLNADVDDYYCSSTNGAGLKILLHNPIDTPHIKETGLPVRVGHQSRFRIKTESFDALSTVRSIQPKQRQCFFNNEQQLHYYKYYSRRNCEMECDSKFMLRMCNCIPNHMPLIYANASQCHVKHFNCLVIAETMSWDAQKLACKDECLPSCNDLSYFPTMFVSPFSEDDYGVIDSYFSNLSREYVSQNLAMAQFYYMDTSIRSYIRTPYTGFTEFLSQTGGIMSLFMGFSVISIVEVFYYSIMRPIFDILLKRFPLVSPNQVGNAKSLQGIQVFTIKREEGFRRNPFKRQQSMAMNLFKTRKIFNNNQNLQNYNKFDTTMLYNDLNNIV